MRTDPNTIEDRDPRTYPHVIRYFNALRGNATGVKRPLAGPGNVIGGDDHGVRRYSHSIADPRPAVAVNHSKGIDTAVIANDDIASVGQDDGEIMNLAVSANGDGSSTAYANNRFGRDHARGMNANRLPHESHAPAQAPQHGSHES
jgi:hypothetical protein